MIMGGSSGSAELSKAKRSSFKDRHENAIIFIKQDAESVLALHNNAMVVTTNITDHYVRYVFIDNRSLVDVLYYSIFSQIGFTPYQLSRFNILIQDFSGDSVIPKGMIKLHVTVCAPL